MENQEILIQKIKNQKDTQNKKIKKEGGKTKVAKFIYIAINVNTKKCRCNNCQINYTKK